MITASQISEIVKRETRMVHVPLNEPFNNLNMTNAQLVAIQGKIARAFNRTVSTIMFSDTVYTLTDRLNQTRI